jgi:hypothetical protein
MARLGSVARRATHALVQVLAHEAAEADPLLLQQRVQEAAADFNVDESFSRCSVKVFIVAPTGNGRPFGGGPLEHNGQHGLHEKAVEIRYRRRANAEDRGASAQRRHLRKLPECSAAAAAFASEMSAGSGCDV